MKSVFRSVLIAATLACAAASSSAALVYTSSAAFLPHVAAGAYTNTFNGLTNASSGSFTGGGFSYTISAPNDIYFSGDFVGVNQEDDALTITFTSGNVTAIGANFFATNLSDAFQALALTIHLSDGTVEHFTPASVANSYRGFVSDVAITSLVIDSAGVSLYSGLDNLTVGTAAVSQVPEPGSLALLGLGLAGLATVRKRTSA